MSDDHRVHPDIHSDILRRLQEIERDLDRLRDSHVPQSLMDARLETIRESITHIRGEITALREADRLRRSQVLAVIGAIVVALVVGLIQSGLLTP